MRQLALAVVTVLALAGCTSVDTLQRPTERSTPPPVLEGEGPVEAAEPWRTEVWHDVQLQVPDSWGVGYAPMDSRGSGALLCGTGPGQGSRAPYVGRPGMGSDLCEYRELDELRLGGEGVWFGSLLPEGGTAWGALEQRTVTVGDTRVTVASKDADVLRRILRSIEQVRTDASGCDAVPEPERGYPDEGYGEVRNLSVCLYEGNRRLWTTRLLAPAAASFSSAVEQADPTGCRPAERPRDQRFGQVLVVRVYADDPFGDAPLPRDYVLHGGDCPALEVAAAPPGRQYLQLTPALIRPWAAEGTRTYAVDDRFGRGSSRYFRPVWG